MGTSIIRLRVLLLAAVVAMGCHMGAGADVLEIREPTYFYKGPNKRSERLYAVSMKDRTGPFVVTLLDGAKVNGYYHVRIPGKHAEAGWVYKSYVRRFEGTHPDYVVYSRNLYKHWTDADSDCQDTRQEVLIRDSKPPVLYMDSRECDVQGGL